MKTSWNNLKEMDDFLSGKLNPAENLFYRVRLLIDGELQMQTRLQIQLRRLVTLHGRRNLKYQIRNVEDKLFTDPIYSSFQQKIKQIF